jgi:calcineurin-like phosphoesterase family protein
MNAGIVKIWNSTVKPGDTVYHLGDVVLAYGKKEEKALYSFLEQVNGNIILLNGNHDHRKTRDIFKEFGHTVGLDYLEINSFDTKIVMSHYPHAVWNKCHHGSVMLHGHSHGSYSAPGRILDVGWDVHGRVLTLNEAYDIAMSKPVAKTDHH